MEISKSILGVLLHIPLIFLTNCSKDDFGTNQKELLGTWIAVDKSDTLEFTTEKDFKNLTAICLLTIMITYYLKAQLRLSIEA